VAGAKRYGGKKDTAWPARKDTAGKKIRRGRREKRYGGKKNDEATVPTSYLPTYTYDQAPRSTDHHHSPPPLTTSTP